MGSNQALRMHELASKANFHPVSTEQPKRLVVSLEAAHKAGKTRWALTAPGPIAYINLDLGLEGVVEPFLAAGKTIMESRYVLTGKGAKGKLGEIRNEDAERQWEQFKIDYYYAMQSGKYRSVVIDTGTELNQLIRLARLGKLVQVEPHHYGPVNAEFEEVLRAGLTQNDTNLIITHKVKDEYIGDKRTGKKERAGYSGIGFIVQVLLSLWRDDTDAGPVFRSRLTDARHNDAVSLIGTDFDSLSETSDFPTLASMIFGTDRSEWE